MAPEIFRSGYNFGADIWAVGVVIYVLLVGHFPFDSGFEHNREKYLESLRKNKLEFPPDCNISEQAIDLIRSIFIQDPRMF
jgi:serine/threonine protein kinase